MDEQPVPKRTLGPSRLRHEIRQESTDDDRATDHIELQVFDSDIVIPETQPKHSPNANDGDDFLLSPKSKAMLAKNAISKSKSATGMDPMEVTLLSKEPLSGTSLEHSQRTFTFSPYTTSRKSPSDEHPSKKTSPDPMDVKSAVDLPTEIAQKDDPEPQPQLAFSPLGSDTQSEQIMEGKGTTSASIETTDVTATKDIVKTADTEPKENNSINMASVAGHDLRNSTSATPPSAQIDRTPFPSETGSRPSAKKRKKAQKGRPIQRHRMIWPPRTSRRHEDIAGPAQRIVDNKCMVVSTPQPAAGIDPSANDECVSDSQEKCGPSIKHDDTDAVPKVQPTTLTDEHEDDTQISDVEVVQSPGTTESRNEHHERMARSSQDRTPEPVLRLVSQQGEPSRITKKPRQTRSQKSILSSILRSNTRPGYAGVASIDPMLDSIRSAFYTESKRIDEFHAAQMKAQSDNIAALQGTINLQNNCINVLQAEKKKLRAKAKDQIDKSNRYIKGIQNDYNKLKETAKVHQQECSTVLEREVAEIQKEKALMERDFRVTLDAMEKSQKSTKNALDELFYSLKLSEARKRDLMVILTSKDQLLEDEKAKRVQLEEQVLFSIHSLQQLLLDNNGDLLEEMSQIQASLDASRVDEKRDVCIQECLEALQVFQKTSIVRVEDVKKAEGMLRFLNESMHTKLEAISASTDDSKAYLFNQLQTIQRILLECAESNTTLERTCRFNEHLSSQLDAEKAKCSKLEEMILNLRRNEIDIQSRSSQLEIQLNELQKRANDLESDPSGFKQQIMELRSQLSKAEGDHHSATTRLQEAEQLRQLEESRAAEFKTMAEEAKEKIAELVQNAKRDRKKANKEAEVLREQLNKDNEKVLQEKDAAWANNLHRISRELEDKERLVQEMTIEYDATKSVLLDVQQQLRSTKAGITMPHQNDSEISKLKGELKQKSLDFQAKQDEIERLRTEHIELQAKAAVLEESVERFNAQLSEQKRLTETLRAEVDARKAEQCNDFVLLQDALDRELALEKGKNGLESSLENARANGASSLKHAEAELTKEKKKLQDQIVQLHTAKEETDRELQRVREQFAEETKTSENYRTEVTNLKLQLEQMSASLGGSHSVQERIEYEYARDQETHERVTKEKMQKKFLEESLAYQKKVDRRKEEEITEIRHQLTQKNRATPEWDSVLSSSRAHASEPCSSNAKKSLLVSLSYSRSRPRKKVSRESNTVFSVDASSNPPSRIFSNDSTTFVESQNPHSLGVRRELMSPSTFNGLGTLEQLDEEGVSFCQSPEEAVSESQQELFSTEAFPDMLMSQAPSSLPGTGQEPIENLEQRASGTPLSTRPTNDQSLSKSAEENNGNTQAHASFNSLSFFNISNLSKSQANTGSQVIPQPPAPFSIKSRKEAQSGSLKTVRPQTGEPKQGFEETVTATSSPDLLHDGSSSATKRTYTNHHIANTPSSRMPHPVSTSMEIVETPSRKRKGSVILSEPGMSKRHIPSSSLSIRGSKYPSLPSQSPVSSRAVRHSRSPMKCSQQAIQSSTGRGSAPRRTKNDRYDFRFS